MTRSRISSTAPAKAQAAIGAMFERGERDHDATKIAERGERSHGPQAAARHEWRRRADLAAGQARSLDLPRVLGRLIASTPAIFDQPAAEQQQVQAARERDRQPDRRDLEHAERGWPATAAMSLTSRLVDVPISVQHPPSTAA